MHKSGVSVALYALLAGSTGRGRRRSDSWCW